MWSQFELQPAISSATWFQGEEAAVKVVQWTVVLVQLLEAACRQSVAALRRARICVRWTNQQTLQFQWPEASMTHQWQSTRPCTQRSTQVVVRCVRFCSSFLVPHLISILISSQSPKSVVSATGSRVLTKMRRAGCAMACLGKCIIQSCVSKYVLSRERKRQARQTFHAKVI